MGVFNSHGQICADLLCILPTPTTRSAAICNTAADHVTGLNLTAKTDSKGEYKAASQG
ncbi:hypothetical protein IFO70_03760 [Phormidium tenue FACHB-886]|nr:hypothetical protein [Phormidium tenue FACHB-886]